jgi:SAM-dependent methyltransferase
MTQSLYEFGSSEKAVRHLQKRFVNRFRECEPVLDIGCGRGIFLSLLRESGIACVGIDFADEAVQASRNNGFTIQQADCLQFLEGPPGRFGGIFCSHVIEHMDYEGATRLIQMCRRALRPGGKLVIVTPNPEDIAIMGEIFWLDPTHVRPYPSLLLCSMLERSGFTVTQREQFHGGWQLIGRRHLPAFYLKKLLLGKHYGRPNTAITATAL